MKRRGFTLIELLVVIAIIAILAAILFPVFAKAREKARQTTCLSNLKQAGIALSSYTQDWDGRLPEWGQYNGTGSGSAFSGWFVEIVPYLGIGKANYTATYGGSGAQFGCTYMRCPSASAIKGTPFYTYGVNFPLAMGASEAGGTSTVQVAAILDKLPPTTFLMADAQEIPGYYGQIYTPAKLWYGPPNNVYYAPYSLSKDTDNDGIPDTCGSCVGFYQYNGLAPRHSGGSDFLFADCHAKWMNFKDWLANKDNVWGDSPDPGIYN
jgi:prepilin-type N-terminal cleavage/methylation domain-containing protein/prepilin-type processing-associated H-X9-DG protein